MEGDSAGGSAKQARDREYQAILPLRGKILNTWEVSPDQVLGSTEIHDIAVALGSILTAMIYHNFAMVKSVFSRMLTPMVCILPPYSVPCSYVIFRNWYKTVTFT